MNEPHEVDENNDSWFSHLGIHAHVGAFLAGLAIRVGFAFGRKAAFRMAHKLAQKLERKAAERDAYNKRDK